MTNAVRKIVRSYFGKTEISIDGLLEILEKTGDSDVALDILLGTYEAPVIPQQSLVYGRTCQFTSYEKWTRKVTYTYTAPLSMSGYVSPDLENVTVDNFREVEIHDYSAPRKWITVEHPTETTIKESDADLDDWLAGVKKLTEHTQK